MGARSPVAGHKPERLGSPHEVAEVLGMPEKTLAEWRSQGKGPGYVKVGRYVRYHWSAVNAWLAEREVKTTGAA
jgi:excisionase family DNA binding protein